MMLWSASLFGQLTPCNPNGVPIFTNPSSPLNVQNPAMVNNFDWRSQFFNINPITNINATQILNPYFQTQNTNVAHLSVPLDGIRDFLPEDGWELITKDFGWKWNNVSVPTDRFQMILYNRFRGILRVFLARADNSLLNGARVSLLFADYAPMSSALDFAEEQRALNDFAFNSSANLRPTIDQNVPFIASPLVWYYADFPIAYDPCTCFYQSLMVVQIKLSANSNLTLGGGLTGTIESDNTTNYQYGTKVGSSTFGKVTKAFKSAEIFKDKSNTMTQNINISVAAKQNVSIGIQNLTTAMKSNSFLKTGLQAIPYLDAAISIWDAFVGGGKQGPQQVEILPMSVNLNVNLTGTIGSDFSFQPALFRTPGSFTPAPLNETYPYYNQVLGVINLLRKPQVRIGQFLRPFPFPANTWTRESYIKLTEPLQFVLNPAAGLEIVEIRGTYISDFIDDLSGGPYSSVTVRPEKNILNNNQTFGTEYINALQMPNTVLITRNTSFNEGLTFSSRMIMKFMIHLRRINAPANAQDVFMVLTYPVDYQFQRLFTQSELNSFRATSAATTYTVSSAVVNSFCSSPTYKTPRGIPERVKDIELMSKDIEKAVLKQLSTNYSIEYSAAVNNKLKIFPNPIEESGFIQYSLPNPEVINIYIIDASGRRVKNIARDFSQSKGDHVVRFERDGVAAGNYIVVFESEKFQISKAIVFK